MGFDDGSASVFQNVRLLREIFMRGCWAAAAFCFAVFPFANGLAQNAPPPPFKTNGFTIVSDEWKVVIPSPIVDGEPSGLPVTLHQSIPQVVEPLKPSARLFNKAVYVFARNSWYSYGGPPRSNTESDTCCDFDLSYSINRQSVPGVISIRFEIDTFNHDGAHGNGEVKVFNWVVTQNRAAEVSDVFAPGVNWQGPLAEAVETNLQQTSDGGLPSDYGGAISPDQLLSGIQDAVSDPHSWIITPKGLTIAFGLEEVGSFMSGEPTATVPWSALTSYLKKGGLAEP